MFRRHQKQLLWFSSVFPPGFRICQTVWVHQIQHFLWIKFHLQSLDDECTKRFIMTHIFLIGHADTPWKPAKCRQAKTIGSPDVRQSMCKTSCVGCTFIQARLRKILYSIFSQNSKNKLRYLVTLTIDVDSLRSEFSVDLWMKSSFSFLISGKHIFSPSHFWPHQQTPSALMMHVPVPQHLGSLLILISIL